jgi:Golgi phosphoprotein 3
LRGAILIELSLRNRITTRKDTRKVAYSDRFIEVIDEGLTGEVLLDEACRIIGSDTDTIANWIDLLSGTLHLIRRNLEFV